MKYYHSISWIWLTHNFITSILFHWFLLTSMQQSHVSWDMLDLNLPPQQTATLHLCGDNVDFFPPASFYSQVQGGLLVTAGVIYMLYFLARIACMLIGKIHIYIYRFYCKYSGWHFFNLLLPRNVVCTVVFSVSVNILEWGSNCSDSLRLDPVLELLPKESKLSS